MVSKNFDASAILVAKAQATLGMVKGIKRKMVKIYFCGLTSSKLLRKNRSDDDGSLLAIDEPTLVTCENMTDIEIGWDYFLIWKGNKLYLSGKYSEDDEESLRLLEIPEHPELTFHQAIAGPDNVTILTTSHELWLYKLGTSEWKRVPDFISRTSEAGEDNKEHAVKLSQGRCTTALSNSGHVFNIPLMLSNPRAIEFVDVACGFDHAIMLERSGDVYSSGMGTRGQLGHGDLDDCDEPRLVEALAGLKVVFIAASGWHSAVLTDQGDLYTWGWNNQGQLGLPSVENVAALPALVDFKNENGEVIELNVCKVQCGHAFTICKTDNGQFWGCGSNKYGQLGVSRKNESFKQFTEIKFESISEEIDDFKCREWATCLYTK